MKTIGRREAVGAGNSSLRDGEKLIADEQPACPVNEVRIGSQGVSDSPAPDTIQTGSDRDPIIRVDLLSGAKSGPAEPEVR